MDEPYERIDDCLRLLPGFNVRADNARALFTSWVQEALADHPDCLRIDFTRLPILTSTIIAMTHLACGLAGRAGVRVEVIVTPTHRTGFEIIKRPDVLTVRFSA